MLHHTERVGLSYRINKGGGVKARHWSRGCTAQWRISLPALTTINKNMEAKCHENSARDAGDAWRAGVTGQWSTGGEVRLQA